MQEPYDPVKAYAQEMSGSANYPPQAEYSKQRAVLSMYSLPSYKYPWINGKFLFTHLRHIVRREVRK